MCGTMLRTNFYFTLGQACCLSSDFQDFLNCVINLLHNECVNLKTLAPIGES